MQGLAVTEKYIDITAADGTETDVILYMDRDVSNITIKESVNNLATAIYATGKDGLTLSGYTYDDGEDFYVNGKYLFSRQALENWRRYAWKPESSGDIYREYSCEATTKLRLCEMAMEQLKIMREPEINYEVDIRRTDVSVSIRDRISVVDDKGELYLSAKVLQLETSATSGTKKATLGDYIMQESGISDKVMQLASGFSELSKTRYIWIAYADDAKGTGISLEKSDKNYVGFSINHQSSDVELSNPSIFTWTVIDEVKAENARQLAEAAKTAADNAASKAQAAQATADEAAGSASQANTLAEAAQASADQAKQSAAAAQSTADTARGAVDAVAAGVASLETSVDNAQKAADNAKTAADTAQAAADNAQQSADNAAAEAETAKTNAATAQTKAEEAAGSAASAQETANDAVSKANAAQVTANTARSEVAQANEEIDGLSTSLETTKQTLEADYSKKGDLSTVQANLQAQITENAAQIEITHTKVIEVDETANDAKEKAEAAQTAAGKAQTDATAAKTAAANAQTAADNAKTAADNAQSEADAAKTAATNARSVADKAQEDLEAAQADLAAVTGRVDATEEDIAAAQAAVTTAQAAADKAKQDAATAQTKAETAQTAADEAATKATNAQTKANEAKTAADDAALAAGKAQTDATAAKTAANAAQSAAETAQTTANTAKTNAAAAQTKADQAATDAAAAQSTADAAKTKAETAQTDLNTAKENLEAVKSRVDATEEDIAAAEQAVQTAQTKADEAAASAAAAQSTADTAKTNAATAQAAADEAKEDAAAAQTAADNAKTAADAAQADVNSLKTRVTKTETDIKKNADAIALTATKEEVTETLGGYYTKEEADAAIEVKADSITQTVSNTYATKQGLADANTQIETNKSQIEQTADRLKLLIKSGDTESSLVLTDKLIELAAAGINLKGLVSFSGLNSDAQKKVNDAQETANGAAAKADLVSGVVSGTDTFDISVSGSLSEESAQIDIQVASGSGKFTTPGEYTFSYSGSGWTLDGNSVTLSDYGITLNGTPVAGDTITVVYDDSGLVDEINELNRRADEISSDVGSLSDAASALQEQADGLSEATSKLQERADDLSEATSKLQAVQETASKEMAGIAKEMEGYRGCVVIDGSEPSITVGAGSDAKTNIKITPEKMSFMNNGNEAASLSNDTLKADSAEITNLYMRSVDDSGNAVGTLGWIARANGHLSLRVIG